MDGFICTVFNNIYSELASLKTIYIPFTIGKLSYSEIPFS